jgi:hypothetical protein
MPSVRRYAALAHVPGIRHAPVYHSLPAAPVGPLLDGSLRDPRSPTGAPALQSNEHVP